MDEKQIDLRKLAEEAMRETYSPRAKRCWFRWQHEWTMWAPQTPNSIILNRRCLRCGWVTTKVVKV